jgi:hypothetical protein
MDRAPPGAHLKNASREAPGPVIYSINYFLLLEGEGVMRSMTDEVLVFSA